MRLSRQQFDRQARPHTRPVRTMFFTLGLIALAAISRCRGQSTTEASTIPRTVAAAGTEGFSGEPAIIVTRNSVVTMHADGTGIRENTLSVRIQTDAAVRQFGVLTATFSSSAEHPEFLYVRVRHHDGTVTETPVKDAIEQPEQVTREAPFYSDLKTLQLPVKNLGVGDTVEWQTQITRTVAEAPGQFWGQETFINDGIALAESLELHVPVSSRVTIWTNPAVAAPTDAVVGSERVVRWSSSHLIPSVGPVAEAAKKNPLTPEQELTAHKGALPSLAWTTFSSWQAVGDWYRALEADRMKPNAAIAAKVSQLTSGKSTEIEKAQAVYDYVATQVRYIGVAFGVGRYQPHNASEVLANQYGDCKDKHTLLAAMLMQLGLQPDAVLIGAGVRFNAALPSPGSFNHLITQVSIGGRAVWLDTTAEVAPWGTLVPLIRDQQALVVPSASPAALEQTPATPPFTAYSKLVATETLDKSLNSDARITLTFHDDDEISLRSALRQVSPAQYPEFVQRLIAAMGFGGKSSEPEISHPDDLEHPLTISYRYERTKEEAWGENRITEPFWPMPLPTIDDKDPPTASIELGIPRTETSVVEIKLPEGWSAELPEAIHAKAPFAMADMTFRISDGKITAERKLTIFQSRISLADLKEYKRWTDEAQINSFPYIQLILNGSKPPISKPGSPGSVSAVETGSAEQLVAQAVDALRTMNTEAATHLLDQAKALNPKQRQLWGEYAYVSYLRGEISKGTEEVTQELALHPDEVQMYGLLATLQEQRADHEAAIATLRRWIVAAPDKPEPVVALMLVLHKLKRDDEAMALGVIALAQMAKTDTNLTQTRLVLADLQRTHGNKAAAASTIQPLVGAVSDLSEQNSVAYVLADAKVNLSGDDAMEREILIKLDKETTTWTLDEAPETLKSRTALLIACWDTMGWILFQEGHLVEARNYIAAAWENTAPQEILDHFSAVNKAMHQPSKEETVSDQSRRTFPLGPAQGRHGTAELRLLLGAGKVLRSEPVGRTVGEITKQSAAPALTTPDELVRKADLHVLFPDGSGARMVRRGIVNCSGPACQLVLEPLAAR